ncbi:MAG: dihydrofolate reductase [Akkermansiaceae bacterium]|nr:dihydrofolate reductase [Akkermansiaceae bacterium]
MSVQLTAVVAMTADRVIGKDGTLPWHLPEDLKFFKRTTSGYPIVMGRKTYESIGRPLPKRRNIVLTRDRGWSAEGVEVIHAPEDLHSLSGLDGRVFIIGGAEIYRAFTPLLDDWLVSHVGGAYEGDTRLAPFEEEFPVSEIVEAFPEFVVRRWSRLTGPAGAVTRKDASQGSP